MIDIKHNFTDCIEDLESMVKDQIPFATSLAMNNALKSVREKVKAEMDNHIEGGPTYFTRTGMMLFATSKDDPDLLHREERREPPNKSRNFAE